MENAKAFCRENDAVIKEQDQLTGEELAKTIEERIEKNGNAKFARKNSDSPINPRYLLADEMIGMISS